MLKGRTAGHAHQPTIVFLHAIATSGWMWEGFFPNLPDYHCVALDLPGHGLSHSSSWRSMEDAADQVAEAILLETGGGPCHLVGLSLGAYVGLTLVARHPTLVERALFSGINVLPLPNKWLMNLFGYATAPFLKMPFMINMNARALRIPADQSQGYQDSVRQLAIKAYLAASRDAGNFTTPVGLSASSVPTLLTIGSREHSLIRQSMVRLAGILPNAETLTIDSGGHGWPGEFPNLFSEVVSAWCTRGEVASTAITVSASVSAE